jgi:hypothetical protein
MSKTVAALMLVLSMTPAAPAGGVVPGLTGPAALKAAGAAADHFRALTPNRVAELHDAWGIFFNDNASSGLQATHTVLDITASGGDYVYAPTALPPGNSCIELTTAYTPDGPKLWAWDWCGGRDTIGKLVDMDSTFTATYTTTVNGRRVYSMDEHRTSTTANTWTVYLMNYRTHAWDVFYTSSGQKDIPGSSWDFFEIYTASGSYCHDLSGRTIEASGVKVSRNGSWVPAAPSNSGLDAPPPGSAFDCPSMTFTVVHANDDWSARTS